jgi:hypothetical protein
MQQPNFNYLDLHPPFLLPIAVLLDSVVVGFGLFALGCWPSFTTKL